MAKQHGKVAALVGAQFGSEGKGVVAKHYADEYQFHVRTGGPNAGHSMVHNGELYKMQSLPCGWVNPDATLVIGAGAVVNPTLLRQEIAAVAEIDPSILRRVMIDGGAGVISKMHIQEEGHTHGEIHQRIGSTGEGVGAARHGRMARVGGKFTFMRDVAKDFGLEEMVVEGTSMHLNHAITSGSNVMLEGTQGFGLSLIHGIWPFVTSADTNAAQLAADAGIAPQRVTDVILVARTYPIRVAGNSGPLWAETNWGAISEIMGRETEERTTVTKKVRRIGEWDEDLFRMAVDVNFPTEVVITFMDYLSPECENVTREDGLTPEVRRFIEYVERSFGVAVSMVGTGFDKAEGWKYVELR